MGRGVHKHIMFFATHFSIWVLYMYEIAAHTCPQTLYSPCFFATLDSDSFLSCWNSAMAKLYLCSRSCFSISTVCTYSEIDHTAYCSSTADSTFCKLSLSQTHPLLQFSFPGWSTPDLLLLLHFHVRQLLWYEWWTLLHPPSYTPSDK